MTRLTRRAALALLGTAVVPGRRAGAQTPAPPPSPQADADRDALVAGHTEFAFDLYAKLRGAPGNVFFSPYSISTALAMTWAGARGATAAEMARTLRISPDPSRVHPASARLIREIGGAGTKRASELYTASALWSRQGHPFVASFQTLARESYAAALEEVDFGGAPETARRTINAWVERQTRDKIKDLLAEGAIQPDTLLVLTNAIYFKGSWLSRFAQDRTTPGDFLLGAEGKRSGVPLMHQRREHRYMEDAECQALELPYDRAEASMIVLLPRRVDGLGGLEGTLTAARVGERLAALRPREVDVILPRFTLTVSADLNQPLGALGMSLAFSRRAADFSGMVAPPPRAYLSAVVHKAYADVNEEGTEAAAATGVVARPAMAPRPPVVFRADHPFVFLIRDNRTGSILFAGRLSDPQAR